MSRPEYAASTVPCLLCGYSDAYDETDCPESGGAHVSEYDLQPEVPC